MAMMGASVRAGAPNLAEGDEVTEDLPSLHAGAGVGDMHLREAHHLLDLARWAWLGKVLGGDDGTEEQG